MLDRYQKSGGFLQLLSLIETCGPAKQEKFLAMIREEDPRWADVIEKKMLTIKRVFSWPQEALAEVIGSLQDLTIAVILHGLDEPAKAKIYLTFSHGQRRRIDELYNTQRPTPAEISTMYMKLITEVRKMISEGRLRMDRIDSELVIEDTIEEDLKKAPRSSAARSHPDSTESGEVVSLNFDGFDALSSQSSGTSLEAHREEAAKLRKHIVSLNQENASLKSEVSKLRIKLDQVRKAVA